MGSQQRAPKVEPERIGPFTITRQLSQGGMAMVYQAVEPIHNGMIAVKVADERYHAELIAEAAALRSLDHPNIVKILPIPLDQRQSDVYVNKEDVDGQAKCYVALEFIDGGSLQEVLDAARRRHRFVSSTEILRIVEQIARALDYAHARQKIHLDVKPTNILLSKDRRRTVLTDFGIFQSAEASRPRRNVGTPPYMAPEHARGGKVDYRADLYSLGVVLYELYTGRLPYDGKWTTTLRKLVSSEPFPPPRTIRPDIPRAVEAVILRALDRDPGRRYQTGRALVDDLRRATPGGPSVTPRFLAIGVAVVLVLAASVGVYVSVAPGPEPTPMPTTVRAPVSTAAAKTSPSPAATATVAPIPTPPALTATPDPTKLPAG